MIRKSITAIISTIIALSSMVSAVSIQDYSHEIEKAEVKEEVKTAADLPEPTPAVHSVILTTNKKIVVKPKQPKETKPKDTKPKYIPIQYNPHDVTKASNASVEKIRKALSGTSMVDLASYFIEAEQEYHINAFFLAGLTANESGWNTSQRASKQNNLTGHGVYSRASRGSTFLSKRQCILETARLLREDYIQEDGQFYTGADIKAINSRYSGNSRWADTINSIAKGLVAKANRR